MIDPTQMDGVFSYTIARLAEDDELDQVVSIEAASFTNPWTREILQRELLYEEVARVYVVRAADRTIVAFCACWFIVDELHINTLAVDAAHRRRGIATKLVDFVLGQGRASGMQRATLDVRRSNEAALRMYRRLGFVVTAVRKNYYTRPEEDGLILWRDDLHGPPG
ncbi:MAG: ribosomal protein S18-alanine N-acetyltransferase [Acidobacteriota bacterium]